MSRSISSYFRDIVQKNPRRTCVINYTDNGVTTYTYNDIKTGADKLSNYLKTLGLSKNAKIAIYSKNSPEWIISFFAIYDCGAAAVPLDTLMHPSDVIHILRHCDAEVLIVSKDMYNSINLDSAKGLNLKKVIVTDHEYKDTISLEQIIKEATDINDSDPHPVSEENLAVIIYTSGTTGSPKGVCLSHSNILHQIDVFPNVMEYNYDDRFIGILPYNHAFGIVACLLAPFAQGCAIVFPNTLKSSRLIEIIEKEKISVFIGVPALFDAMKKSFEKRIESMPLIKKFIITALLKTSAVGSLRNTFPVTLLKTIKDKSRIKNVRVMVSGGAPLSEEIGNFFKALGITFIQGYGLTETSPVISINNDPSLTITSVGRPVHSIKLKIMEPDSGGIGELAIKGPNVMQGYYLNKQATDEVFQDGWFMTGDLGYQDKEGNIFIKGRRKNVIVTTSGKNVYPEEIEEVMLKSQFIKEIVVFGKALSELNQGERVEAVIHPDFDIIDLHFKEKNIEENKSNIKSVIKKEIIRLSEILPTYKKIKDFSVIGEELQKTSTRKIKRYLYK